MKQNSKEEFGSYIAKMREKHSVSMEQLSDGILDLSVLGRFEKGERFPDKMTRDRLLGRMGETADSYENYLHYDEYRAWKIRQKLLQSIVDLNEKKARDTLLLYRKIYDKKNIIEKQFVLAMEAMLIKKTIGQESILSDLYAEAMLLTIPYTDRKYIFSMKLSMQELYLVLQYVFFNVKKDEKRLWYEDLLNYISMSVLDSICKAKIFPQTVFCFFKSIECELDWKEELQFRTLELCNTAVEMLRVAGGSYYLWEVLQIRKYILNKMKKSWQGDESEFIEQEKQNDEWVWALKEVREEFGRPLEMQDECYLFVEKEAYCIGDVVKKRRKMLGLTREKLANEGICSLRTLEQLETHRVRTHRIIVRDLFERLNLPREFQRTALVTSDYTAQRLMDELKWYINERKCERVDEILCKLEKLVPLDIPMNRQVIMETRICNREEKGEITKEDVILCLREILEYTVPYESVVSEMDCYLTNEEITCIHNMISGMSWEDPECERCINVLYRYYNENEQEKCIGSCVNMYELVMSGIASFYGNKGEFDKSDEIAKSIIMECLKWNRINFIPNSIYNCTWNYEQREKKHIPTCKKRNVFRDIKLCIAFSNFGNREFKEQSYKIKLQQRLGK